MRPLFMAWSIAAFFGCVSAIPARAVPPTVTPSPGYDARLAEQRRALQSPQPVIIEKPQRRRPVIRHRHKH